LFYGPATEQYWHRIAMWGYKLRIFWIIFSHLWAQANHRRLSVSDYNCKSPTSDL